MLTHGEDVEVHALRNRGWSYQAIGRDWRTVKAYLEGRTLPGVRRRAEPDPLERFVPYLKARFVDDPHVWSSTLSTRWWSSAMTAPIRASPASCGWRACVRTARRARG